MRKVSVRAPGSLSRACTRTGAPSPSRGSWTSVLATTRPSSSTTSGTFAPANPRCRTSTSAITVLPSSTACALSTRRTSMSFSKRSAPIPTVNTGTDRARSVSSSSAMGVRALSAPSVSRTIPESGSDSMSRRAASSASPRRVSLAVEGEDGVGKEGGGGAAGAVGDLHAPGVVEQYADVVPVRHRGREQELRPEEQDDQHEECRDPERHEHDAVPPRALAPDAAVGEERGHPDSEPDERQHDERCGRAEAEVPLLEDRGPVLEEKGEERAERVGHQGCLEGREPGGGAAPRPHLFNTCRGVFVESSVRTSLVATP